MTACNRVRLRKTGRRMVVITVISLSAALAACVYDPVYYGPPAYPKYRPHYYDYYYYPHVGVYFHFTTGYYYYRDRNRWLRARTLPPHIHIDVRDRVKLRIDSDKPYLQYPEHHRAYKRKPEYRVDKERSVKEREANRRWYRDYEQHKDKRGKREKDDERDRKRRDR